MAEEKKTIEMRVAELEDKLQSLQVSEDEMKAFNKVSALLSGGGGAGTSIPTPGNCVISQCISQCIVQQCIRACTVINQCTIRPCTIQQCTIRACTIINECINECGGGLPGGGGGIGGGFGTLGG